MPKKTIRNIKVSQIFRILFYSGILVGVVSFAAIKLLSVSGAEAAPWAKPMDNFLKRKQLTLQNLSGQTFEANTTYTVTINTKQLYDAGDLQSGCQDIRVVYQPNNTTAKKINYYFDEASGATCATSTATKIHFPLQANISSGGTDNSYYIYYKSPGASSESTVDAFDIGAKEALMHCGFNGDTNCINGSGTATPTTESGAVRYNGAKSALRFDGNDDKVRIQSYNVIGGLDIFTLEFWLRPNIDGSTQRLFDELGSQMALSIGSGGSLSGSIKVGGVNKTIPSISLSDNTWVNISIVYDGSSIKSYKDGVLSGTTSSVTGAVDTSAGVLEFGGGRWAPDVYLGLFDEMRISNTARYTSNFTPSTAPFTPDEHTVLLYHFDENGDDPRNTGKAIDSSGNGNHGTITGAKYVGGLVGVDSSASDTGNFASQQYAGHSGIFIEEGTTNKITNPSYEHSTYNNNWGAQAGFKYDSTADTFTPGMAKRNSAGPFASGVAVQGKADGSGTSDTVSFSEGTQLNDKFYNNFDGNQGSLSFWITPEWNGNDGQTHFILGNGAYSIYKHSNNNLLIYSSQAAATLVQVDVSSWTAGTTYQVTFRWDSKNTLDGTNYASISINDSHTFGRTSSFTIASFTDTYIGSNNSSIYPLNAIIEGFTIYRRPLFDGTYGIDVGNGDEIAQIYNSGTGRDPTLVTGSWDVVFALPTNASTGALTTGTGNAWSHPHASNLLYTSTTNTGGFMMNGTYTTDGFADVGSPSSIGALATNEKIFAGGYKFTSTGANQGIYRSFTATSGGDYVLRTLGHSDGTCSPQVKITRADGTTEISRLDGTTTSTRTDPDVYIFTWEAPAAEANQIQLLNTASSGTCYWHQVEVLSNLITNPSMETGSGDPWIPTGWINHQGYLGAGESVQELVDVHFGSSAFKTVNADNAEGISNPITTTSGKYYAQGGWGKVTSGQNHKFIANNLWYFQDTASTIWSNIFSSTSWTHSSSVSRAAYSGTSYPILSSSNVNYNGLFDDFYLFPLTDVSLTITPASEANSSESTGLRVDGTDTLTQTISSLTTTSGGIKFKFTPRHSYSTAASFGISNPVIATFYYDANNYLKLFYSSSTVLRLTGVFNGTTVNADYSTPTLNAGTTYELRIKYTSGGNLTLDVDGTQRATASGVVAFANTPTTAYWGADNSGANQYDSTITEPAFSATPTPTSNTTAPYYKFGSKSAKLVASADGQYVTSINPGNTNTHTLSAYVYDGTSGNVGGTVSSSIARLVFNGSVVTPSAYTDMGGGWWRLTYSATTVNASGDYGVAPLSGKTVYVDGVQLEDKAYATTYADGSLGTGYSWSGTADDSTGVRAGGSELFATSNNISSSAGSVSFWFRPNDNYPSGTNLGSRNIGLWKVNEGSGYIYPYWWTNGTGTWQFLTQYYNGSGNSWSGGVSSSLTRNNWYNVVVTWDVTGVQMYVNNSAGTKTATAPVFSGGTLGLGVDASSRYGNAVFSDFRTYSSALTATEVADLYYSGLGMHQEQTQSAERFTGNGEPPVLNWKLSEGYGTTAYDSSLFQNNGTISGATWDTTIAPPVNSGEYRSLKFDGSNDYVSRSYTNDTELNPKTGDFTVGAWFRHGSSISSTQYLISRYNGAGYKVYMNSSGYVCFGIDDDSTWSPDDSACTTTSYADSAWHYVQATKTSSAITLYIDGIKQAEDTSLSATGSLSGRNTTFYVGIDSDGTSSPWAGHISGVRVYRVTRDSDAVKRDFISKGNLNDIGTVLGGDNPGGGSVSESALTKGLVGYWPMDEASWNGTSGEVLDKSGNGTNGTSVNGATTSSGKFGNGGSFDGVNDRVTFATAPSTVGNNSISISSWIKRNGSQDDFARIIAKENGSLQNEFLILFNSSNQIYATLKVGGTSVSTGLTPANITDLEWTLVTMTYDGQIMKFYKNSTFIGETAATGNLDSVSGSNFIFGTRGDYGADYYNGSIDEVRIYNRALSPAEVKALYNWAPGPVAHYKFDEGSGTTAQDSSGNGNTGTLTNGPTYTQGKFGKALSFDGSDDYILATSATSLQRGANDPWTISGWYYIRNVSGDITSLTQVRKSTSSHGYYLTYGISNATVSTDYYGGNGAFWRVRTTADVSRNTWHYITATHDGSGYSGVKLYIDGVKVDQTNVSTGSPTNVSWTDTRAAIGADEITGFFDGMADDIRIYNYARTQSQIIEDMNAGHPAIGTPVGSPVLHLSFDEGYGDTAYDKSPQGNNGDLAGTCPGAATCPTWSKSGKIGGALSFDGGDTVSIVDSSSLEGMSAVTFEMWIKPTTCYAGGGASYAAGLLRKPSIYYFGVNTDCTLFTFLSNWASPSSSTGLVATGVWNHLMYTYDGATYAYYINGKLAGSGTPSYTSALTTSANDLRISGATDVGSQYYFNGLIDEVKIYNFALTAEQVALEYNQGKQLVLGSIGTESDGTTPSFSSSREYCVPGDTATCNPPVAEWKFDEGSGTSANDTSGNGNTGTLTNGPTWTKGKAGKGLSFDGDNRNDYVLVNTFQTITNNYTISGWINFPYFSTLGDFNRAGLIGGDDCNSGDTIEFIIGNPSGQSKIGLGRCGHLITLYSTSTFNLGEWTHIVATVDGSNNITYFINGLPAGTASTGTSLAIQDKIIIGNNVLRNTIGLIDQVRIYNYARTPAQIAWEYNKGAPVAHYKFDECSGTTAYNSALNADGQAAGNNGTITIGASGSQTSAGTCSSGVSTQAWNNGTSGNPPAGGNASMNFDGTDDYVSVGNLSTSIHSVSVWVKPSSTTQSVIDLDGGTRYISFSGGTISATGFSSPTIYVDGKVSTTLPDTEWHLVTISTATGFTASNVSIGKVSSSYFNGQIDDVRIYNYALTATQIKQIYNGGVVNFR